MIEENRKNMSFEEVYAELREPARYEFMGDEDAFEQNVVDNLDVICECLGLAPIKMIFRQKTEHTDGFMIRPDIIVRHEDETRTVFEVKKVNTKYPATGPTNQMQAIGQLLLYGSVFKARTGVPWRLALIDTKIFLRTVCAFKDFDLPITLIELQKDRIFIPYNGWRVCQDRELI